MLSSAIKKLKNINLIDKCIIVITIILFLQFAHNLFANEIIYQTSEPIDIIIRTTIASIFGYFISANFVKNERYYKNKIFADIKAANEISSVNVSNTDKTDGSSYYSIGFVSPNAAIQPALQNAVIFPSDENNPLIETNNLQIIIVTFIGIFCLVLLIIARNCTTITPHSMSSLSLLRDIVSGCVGFLLGSPSQNASPKQ